MTRLSKIIVLLGLCFMCIGLLLSSGNFKTLTRPFYNSDDYSKKEYSVSLSDLTKIIVNSSNEKIKVIPSSDNQVTITYYESNYSHYKISNNDGILSFIKEAKTRLSFFNFNIFDPDIVIEVPVNIVLDYNLKTSNSNIELQGLNMLSGEFKSSNSSIKISNSNIQNNLKLTTSNAKIFLEKIDVLDISSKTSNASINISNVKASVANLQTSNSSITLRSTTIQKNIIAKTSNGSINFSELNCPSINLKTSNGRIEGHIIGLASDYTRELKTSLGEVTVNGVDCGKSFIESGTRNYTLTAKTSNDDIDIDFIN